MELGFPGKKPKIRNFDIVAIKTRIVMNRFGDHDPNGMMYVLKENEKELKKAVEENPLTPVDLVQPLVIRANVGDLIVVNFENELDRHASIHIQGVKYDVFDSDGAAVGYNPDSTTTRNKTYKWFADREGTFLFHDMADSRSTEDSTNVHGLFGALIVEAVGATWTDPITGKELNSGLYADIHHPAEPDFREYVVFFQDEPEVKDKNGNPPVNHMTHMEESTFPISYRSEPARNRMMMIHDNKTCPGCIGEEVMMNSWPFGDPSTPILRAYKGDPAKIRLVHGGIMETHVFHLHNHQWRLEPNDPKSTFIDSISISPQECYNINIEFGAGSLNKTAGDVIWHCHLYPHFDMGMWGLWRIFDRLVDGMSKLPDGTLIPALRPLLDRFTPPLSNEEHPGFPLFIPGEVGKKPSKPPLSIIGSENREPTPLEKANFMPGAVRGNLYSDTFPRNIPKKVFKVSLIQRKIVYNNADWHDPEGRFFVLEEDEEDVIKGIKEPEPLVIRANAGDYIEIHLTNKLPLHIGGNKFQSRLTTNEAGWHIHLVKFDAITSDGGSNGWNYDGSALKDDTIVECFYADSELRTVFFHDHLFANVHQQHGVFGALIIEPAGSTYHDPKTGKEIKSGTKAIIKSPGKPNFREFVLAVHDFALLFDKDGKELNPPSMPNAPDDPGVMAINYKNEPLKFREGDPAYVFSSYVHGDPVTPLLEAYEGDPIKIRLFDGAHEESHTFNLHGLRWRKEPTDAASPLVQAQSLGISEAFNIEINEDYKKGDYLYYFGGVDDLWLGLWGILRVYDEKINYLLPLDDRPVPPERTKSLPEKTGNPPPKAENTGTPCVQKGNLRKYNVVAIHKNIKYNSFGDHDPNGLMFVLQQNEASVLGGKMKTSPLILRANAGDLIEVTLTNHLYKPMKQDKHPGVPVDSKYPPSNRVSLHPQLLKYEVLGSDGATVGFNPDQTIGPGESITYRWYADKELGACLLTDAADIRNHRHHGLFGAIIIEPTGSKYHSNITGRELKNPNNYRAIISSPGLPDFREYVLFLQDGLTLYDKKNKLIPDPVLGEGQGHGGEDLDFENQGQKGFNYRCERFHNRLKNDLRYHLVMSSRVHGDPATPLLKVYPGDNVRIRLLMPGDKPRNHSFILHGHSWRAQYSDPFSNIVSSQGAIGPGNVLNIILDGGANLFSGDYAYRSGLFRWDVELGLWGIFRVLNEIKRDLAVINGNKYFEKRKLEEDCECDEE